MSNFFYKVRQPDGRIDFVHSSKRDANDPPEGTVDRVTWSTVHSELPMVRVPAKFFVDHLERALPTPEEVHGDDRVVWLRIDDPALPELLDDARHYAHPCGPDLCSRGLIASAKATVKAIEASLEARK